MRAELFDDCRVGVVEVHSQFLFIFLFVRIGQCKCLFRCFCTCVAMDLDCGFDFVLFSGFHDGSRDFYRVFCSRVVIAQLDVDVNHTYVGKCFHFCVGFFFAAHIYSADHFQFVVLQFGG